MKRLRPVLFVKKFEPCISFWKDCLGFNVILEMSDGNGPGIVVLRKDNDEIVIHALRKSEEAASDTELASAQPTVVLYMEVESLAEVLARVNGFDVIMPLRKSYYGAAEIAIREPGGHVVCFSQTNIADASERQWRHEVDVAAAIPGA
jgi:uncharacterized glyoxalase superfamily protein PhnB